MTDRALIIAIETYDRVTDGFTAKRLDGTLAAALDFRAWLQEKWAREGTTGTIYFCSSPQQPGERAATKDAIVEALLDLQQQGTDSTDNLYVYFSGHGFRLAGDTARLSDVIVTADFVSTQRSADCCLKLDGLIDGLRGSLGHGCHFYFVDACRNEVPKAIAGSLIPFNMEGGEEPSVFVLQSTVAGTPSLVAGPFSKKLREGLRGAGKAKVWDPPITDSMKVRFDSLRRYLKEALKDIQPITQSTSGELGETDVVLAVIAPVVPIELTIALAGIDGPVSGTATITPIDRPAVSHPLSAASTVIPVLPGHYTVSVAVVDVAFDPGAVTIEAYDNTVVTFTRGVAAAGAHRGAAAVPPVEVVVPEGAQAVLRHAAGSDVHEIRATGRRELLPGPYVSTLRDGAGRVIRREEIQVTGDSQRIELGRSPAAAVPANDAIDRALGDGPGTLRLAHALGVPAVDPDLNVRLSVVGAARIVGGHPDVANLAGRALSADATARRAVSLIYVLAGLPSTAGTLRVGINRSNEATSWIDVADAGVLGFAEAMLPAVAGQRFVTFGIGDQPSYTIASYANAHCATLIILTLDEDGQPRVSQYLLTANDRWRGLGGSGEDRLEPHTALRHVYALAQLTRAFRKRRRLSGEFTAGELDELAAGGWGDPIGTALAAYELVRRRASRDTVPRGLVAASAYLARVFPGLPDSRALTRLSGGIDTAPSGVPLLLDGLRAFPGYADWIPYPAGLLHFGGPWTAWKGAVSVPRDIPSRGH